MRKMFIVLSLSFSVLLFTACSNQTSQETKPKHLTDLVNYFKDKGFTIGEKSTKYYQMISAVDGFGIKINNQPIELYEFDPSKSNPTLDNAKNTGKFVKSRAIANGNFMMVDNTNSPEQDKIDKAFKEFK